MVAIGGVDTPEKKCSMCESHFHLHEHQSGLVFDDQFFICESCSTTKPSDEIKQWSQSVMQKPGTGMPIALWLIHEQNREKPVFTTLKKP